MLSRGLSDAEQRTWEQEHRIHLPCPFDAQQLQSLVDWTSELEAWPEAPGRWMKYFEHGKGDDTRQLCRIENFIPYHEGLRQLILGPGVMTILEQLMGETACLFKEKINYKLPGGSGFEPHQDAPAFTSFDQRFHVTLLVAVDAQTRENGCLEFSDPIPIYETLPQGEGGALDTELGEQLPWRPMELAAGDVVFFDSYLPHRSGPNHSRLPRRALYVTYNRLSEGDRRDDYFTDKRRQFPPECEREEGVDYSQAEALYNLGNPIR